MSSAAGRSASSRGRRGLTIRALHHHDEIVPARTEAGHRAYGPDDVERLYRAVALRGVGMALQDIAAALDVDGAKTSSTRPASRPGGMIEALRAEALAALGG